MTRTAPGWFTKWLKRYYPDRRVVWNLSRESWELQKNERQGVCDNYVLELTYPRWNIYSDLCETILKGDWMRRGVRFAEFWRDRVVVPAEQHRQSVERDTARKLSDWKREGRKAVKRTLGKTAQVGAVKNEKLGN